MKVNDLAVLAAVACGKCRCGTGWTSDGPDRSGEVQDLRRFGGCLRSGFGVISLNLLIFLQPLDALR